MARKKSDAVQFLEKLNKGPLTLGQLLSSVRVTDEYTLTGMAKKLGVSVQNLCDVEKGRRTVSPERAAKWAKALGYSQSVFVSLALQAQVDAAGLRLRVNVEAA